MTRSPSRRWLCQSASEHSVSLLPVTQATGFWLFPRWDSFPLNTPAFAGRTAPPLFARAGPVEVWATNDLSVGGQEAFHTICCPPALFNSRSRRNWAPPRPLGAVSAGCLTADGHRESVSRSCRRLLAHQPPTPGPRVRRAASNCPDQTGTSHRYLTAARHRTDHPHRSLPAAGKPKTSVRKTRASRLIHAILRVLEREPALTRVAVVAQHVRGTITVEVPRKELGSGVLAPIHCPAP